MDKIVIAIVKKGKEILMVRRRIKEGDLYWQFPGGALENNESEQQAVEREVFEEANIKCKAIKKLGERLHPTTSKLISYWVCEYVSGEIKVKDSDELDKVEWMGPNEILNNVTSEIFVPVKEYILNIKE
ncbi:MAG: NUDIX hydrolase [Candidatus Paceibacterota bacterium]|jgi:8-oxo-dGTP diphosphatase